MDNYKVAITGGIGSGKTTIAQAFKRLGFPVFSCDEICAKLYKKQSVLRQLKTIFPTAVKGKLWLKADKKIISELTFNDDNLHKRLSDFLQPLIVEKLNNLMAKKSGLVFAEVPLLFEGNYNDLFDKIIVVYRDKNKRVESVKTRSNLPDALIEKIMARQIDYDNYDLTPYFVIKNNGDVGSLINKIEEFIFTLQT